MGILHEAGLTGARITTQRGTARFPSIASWMYTDIKGWVLADMIDDAQFDRLLTHAQQELQPFVAEGGAVAFAAPAHLVVAHKM